MSLYSMQGDLIALGTHVSLDDSSIAHFLAFTTLHAAFTTQHTASEF
jgi:hypothetical protein